MPSMFDMAANYGLEAELRVAQKLSSRDIRMATNFGAFRNKEKIDNEWFRGYVWGLILGCQLRDRIQELNIYGD